MFPYAGSHFRSRNSPEPLAGPSNPPPRSEDEREPTRNQPSDASAWTRVACKRKTRRDENASGASARNPPAKSRKKTQSSYLATLPNEPRGRTDVIETILTGFGGMVQQLQGLLFDIQQQEQENLLESNHSDFSDHQAAEALLSLSSSGEISHPNRSETPHQ